MCINGFLILLYYSKVVNEFAELNAISQVCPSSSETMNVILEYPYSEWNEEASCHFPGLEEYISALRAVVRSYWWSL